MAIGATSGVATYRPPLNDLVIECYARLQIRGPSLTTEHVIEARRSMNLILSDWSGNRSVNLWAVDLISLPLLPGVATYTLPADTIQLLDVYLRQYQPNSPSTNIGNPLTPMLAGGVPMITAFGDPMILAPGSGTLSTVAGSNQVVVTWPGNGIAVGEPVFFTSVASVGGLVLFGAYPVGSIIDGSNFVITANAPAFQTQTLAGAPPLLQTTAGSTNVIVIYPQHGMSDGDTFIVPTPTTVGGITFNGDYPVTSVISSSQFTITAPSAASGSTAEFSNGGLIQVATQLLNVDPIDIVMYGLSRTDYASIPDKFSVGRPTTFWLDRQIVPIINFWEVPPPPAQTGGIFYVANMYRMRQIQNADPMSGQVGDFPQRFFQAFVTELTASLAEKFAPAMFKDKYLLAVDAWKRAATEDGENVPWFITPGLAGYYM